MHPIAGTITTVPRRERATDHQLMMLAHALATVKHSGQQRKGTGEAYMNHVIRVAGRVMSVRERTVAFLHDLLEDTNLQATDLKWLGFPWDVVEDVIALSRRPGETYMDFIERTIQKGSDDALRVKLADLQDNLDDDWTWQQGESHSARYIKADVMIRSALRNRQIKREEKATMEERMAAKRELEQKLLDKGLDPGSANRLSYAFTHPQEVLDPPRVTETIHRPGI